MQYVRCHVKGKRLDALDVVVIYDAPFQDVLSWMNTFTAETQM
jgi:hypothetical protein